MSPERAIGVWTDHDSRMVWTEQVGKEGHLNCPDGQQRVNALKYMYFTEASHLSGSVYILTIKVPSKSYTIASKTVIQKQMSH